MPPIATPILVPREKGPSSSTPDLSTTGSISSTTEMYSVPNRLPERVSLERERSVQADVKVVKKLER